MQTTVQIEGRNVEVETTSAADRALRESGTGISAEMELYFSCLIRKKVRFHPVGSHEDEVSAGEGLTVRFRPVMTASCSVDTDNDKVPVADFPIKRPEAYVPRWLRVDYRHGQWVGEFGYINP
jgi:hypothetical protein